MSLDEARAWLRGERSMANFFRGSGDDPLVSEVALAQADAAMTQQAYWIVKAHDEGLVATTKEASS